MAARVRESNSGPRRCTRNYDRQTMIGGVHVWRFILAALLFALLFGGLSSLIQWLINEQWLGPGHEKCAVFRPDEACESLAPV